MNLPNIFICLLDHAFEAPFANMKMACWTRAEMALILAKSGTQYVAMVRKLLSAHYRAHLEEYYQAIHHHHLSFHLYLSQCNLLHNLHSLQNVIHRQNRETSSWPNPRTPSWRKETRQNWSHLNRSRDTILHNHCKPPMHGNLRPLPTLRKHGKPQNTRTIFF